MKPFGTHVSVMDTLQHTFEQSSEMGMPAFQVFLGSPQSYTRRRVDKSDIQACQSQKGTMFIHSPYAFSLSNPEVFAKCEESLAYELTVCGQMGCKCGGVVVHPGSSKDLDVGLRTAAENINELYESYEGLGTLLLENSAGQGTTLPTRLEHLERMLNFLSSDVRSKVGVCLDTCHSFASGETDFEDVEAYRGLVQRTIGLERLKLIHLNDSKHPLGARKDRHETLGKGHVWTSEAKLMNFLRAFKDVPKVTETGTFFEDVEYIGDELVWSEDV
jgi:deoxyribonuclease-4